MARPQKYTVDYFPHLCKQGKTMYILEARYGNNGYAFWFKLLEILATTEGHYFIANDNVQWEFLGAKTRFPTDEMGVILGLLAGIEAIDKELWESHKLIWCQNLVDNVGEVYENRKGLLPEKPYYEDGILRQNIDIHNINPISSTHNTQSKLKETKLKETKLNKESYLLPDYINDDTWNAYLDMRKKKKAVPTEHAIKLILKDLEAFNTQGQDPNKVLEMSIKSNWTGVFPLGRRINETHQGNLGKPKEYTDPEQLRREARDSTG